MGRDLGVNNFVQHSSKFSGIYRGKVMDVTDSSQYGRIKVQIYPMFSGIATANLPWAVPAMPLYDGAASGTGSFIVPKVGSMVYCFFEGEDMYQPVYFMEAQDALKGLPTERTTDYPTTKVQKTTGGYIQTLNDTLGDKYTNIVNDETKEIGNDKELDVGNNDTETIGLNQTTTVTGNKTTTVGITNTLVTVLNYICTIGYNFTMTVVNMASIIDLTGQRLCQTGDLKPSMGSTYSGWLLCKPDTIGKTGSGATYTGSQYSALFEVLKDAAPNTGTESWDGLDTITLPDFRGRSVLGVDNMGGSQANVLTATYTTNRNTLGGTAGVESHSLTEAELAEHDHAITVRNANGGNGPYIQSSSTAATISDINTQNAGSGTAHQNVGPSIMCNWFIKI